MLIPTRRSVLRGTLGLAAAGALGRPYIANAQAKTATVWWVQGFFPEEDEAFRDLAADYEKTSGNKLDLEHHPVRADAAEDHLGDHQRRRPRSDLARPRPRWCREQAWDDKLVDVTDVVETQKVEDAADRGRIGLFYNSEHQEAQLLRRPVRGRRGAVPHLEGPGRKGRLQDVRHPDRWDAFIDFFIPIAEEAARTAGCATSMRSAFVVSTIGNDPTQHVPRSS